MPVFWMTVKQNFQFVLWYVVLVRFLFPQRLDIRASTHLWIHWSVEDVIQHELIDEIGLQQ